MSGIKLSFCIPTYNRAPFLENALSYFETRYRFDFPYEIVISDNASADNTAEVVEAFRARGLPIRYYRRSSNGGSLANSASAFHHALGTYALSHADDDTLVPEGIVEAVRFLDANPDVVACHAPWTLYNEVAGKDVSQFYSVDANRKFERGSFAEVFQFMYERHIFPEIGIYRASVLKSAWVPREFCFWAFSYLAHFLEEGAVAFLKRPFYRSVTVSKVAARQQAGNDQVMTDWDKYRGGLEYFLYLGLKRGRIPDTREARADYEQKCRAFTLNRMAVAVRFWAARKDYIKAYELYTRMAIGGLGEHPEVAKLRQTLPLMAGIQTLAWHAASPAGIKRLMLSGVADRAALEEMLRQLGLPGEIEVVEEPSVHSPEDAESTAVFVPNASSYDRFVSLGYKPNLIFTDRDLVGNVVI
ncbi:glycosyl transferase [Hyphomicrobium nitrativorans NL23]|uniref:Glycosyl transferase n=1 Tax=Hyphomicrobium nitrativorans NL23 TaxID=1029756 RepID=V5SAV0_9HYPH|nr:glycosyltransferase [Hyphomicrobium nitrativorans]AHB47557.1 glycosyl transferase [Hyphomicrobium nitrativorans NL23]